MLHENVVLASSSNRLGNRTNSNSLIVTFKPTTTMAPSGEGTIMIGIPYQYYLTTTGQRMYSTTADDKCSSPCFNVKESTFQSDRIKIVYDQMVNECIKGTEIAITCRQFYNPVVPEPKNGFFIITQDSEGEPRPIEEIQNVVLDATNFLPAIIPIKNFEVGPRNATIQTYSEWTFSLKVNIPIDKGCWIEIFLPPDFVYKPYKIYASGIFMKDANNEELSLEDLRVTYRNNLTVPKSSVFFDGCHSVNELGEEPFGDLEIADIGTPNSVKDSETFEIKIYKDQAKTKLIAQLEDGKILPAQKLEPGTLLNMTIKPLNTTV